MNNIELLINKIKSNPIEKSGDIYHPIPFTEFDTLSISSDAKAVEQKWNWIQNQSREIFDGNFKGKKILDIGANAGFYSYSFAKLGAKVTAFENNSRYNEIAQTLIVDKGLKIDWHAQAFDHDKISGKHFDLCIMLSVYQWMADGGKDLAYAQKSLNAISKQSDYLIFELGFNKGKSCLNTKSLNHYGALIKLLKQETEYVNFKLIGKTKLWRNYKRFLVICSKKDNVQDTGFYKILRKINI